MSRRRHCNVQEMISSCVYPNVVMTHRLDLILTQPVHFFSKIGTGCTREWERSMSMPWRKRLTSAITDVSWTLEVRKSIVLALTHTLNACGHHLSQCCLFSIGPLGTNFSEIFKNFSHDNASENIVCEMAAILSRGRFNTLRPEQNSRHSRAAILHTTSANTVSWMKIFVFWLKFYWSLLLMIQLTMGIG